MRIRKRPAASTQTPQHPSGSANITINGDLQKSHQPCINTAPAVNKPLINSLHLISAQNNSSHGNKKHSSLAVTNFRQPLADRLQLQNAASSCAEPANPKLAVFRNNPISHFRHSLGLSTEHICPASAPIRISSAANSETVLNQDDQSNNRAGADLHSSPVYTEALPELIIPPNSSTVQHRIKDRLQGLAVAEQLHDLHRKSANIRKRRKTTTLMTSNPKLISQDHPSINKAPKQLVDIPKLDRQIKGKAHDVYTQDPVPNYAEDYFKQNISTSNKIMKLKRRWRKTMTNQQRSTRFDNSEVRTDHSTLNHNNIASSSTTVAQCNRQDGRRWRCKNPVAPGYLYCEYHSAQMSKNFRLKLLQQKQEQSTLQHKQKQSTLQQKQSTLQHKQKQSTLQQKQKQSTLQLKQEQRNNAHGSDNLQLDLNVPITADVSDSSSTSADDPQIATERHKRRKRINQQSQFSSPVIKNSLNHSTDIDSTARIHYNNSNINLNQLLGSPNSAIKQNPRSSNSILIKQNPIIRSTNSVLNPRISSNSVIKQNPIRSTNRVRKQINQGHSIRGRWRKKCKPHMRKLNEIQDVVAAHAIINNSDMKRIKSSIESRHGADINEDDDLSSEFVGSAAGESDNSKQDCNLEPIKHLNRLEICKKTSITARPIDHHKDVDSDDDELALCSSGDQCRNSYKVPLTSSSNGELSSSYVIGQVQFTAFSKLLKAAAGADLMKNPDEEIKAVPPAQMYGNGGSVLSLIRTEEIETLPKCILNSDPCEWRSDLFN